MKKYLLDTHAVLWFAEYSDKLSGNAYTAIQDLTADEKIHKYELSVLW